MLLFVLGIVLLVLGYFTYGAFVEKIQAPDDRRTPAERLYDGIDYVPLPHWKNMLIQLLNIAGVGPVIGVIAGIKFGSIVFLLIPIGNIIGGATHDFISGMASLRNNGGNLPAFIRGTLGDVAYRLFSVLMVFLLLLVVAVFINIPATLVNDYFCPNLSFFWWAVAIIFLYYVVATIFPVDKIIGSLYPFFGALLICGSLGLLGVLIFKGIQTPSIFSESATFTQSKEGFLVDHPILPCLFVTIACGILSGFHATQSPIIARTMKTERQARSSFYGMMIMEGIIAMIWAAGALYLYNLKPELWSCSPTKVLTEITTYNLGAWMGGVTIAAVIILAVTSGDTAMRCLRLSLAEAFKINQKPLLNRFAICLPLILIVAGVLWWSNLDAESFGKLWNYFAWGNQTLAVFTLGAGTVWLYSLKKQGWISAIPGLFMTFIVVSFILWTSEEHKGPIGAGLDLKLSYILGAIFALLYMGWCVIRGLKYSKTSSLKFGEPASLENTPDNVGN